MYASERKYKCERFALQFALLTVHRQDHSRMNDLLKKHLGALVQRDVA
jgi:hypothetical protein